MTLKEEITEAKSREFNSKKWTDIHDQLKGLALEHGHDEAGPWVLVWTAFHGGGLVSRHKTATRAIEKSRKMAGDCTCGCTAVVLAANYDELPTAEKTSSPYAAAK